MLEVDHPGWLYWRPKTIDGKTWYVTAYWHEHGKSALLNPPTANMGDGLADLPGERNDETDSSSWPTAASSPPRGSREKAAGGRPQGLGTLIAIPSRRTTSGRTPRARSTRFDGPCLFPYNGRVYGVGRYQSSFFPRVAEQGGLFSRKRTSLFQLDERGITRLTDLPSAGDTSYAGIAMRGDEAYVSYYTSDVKEDPPWVIGMFRPSAIKMARISLPALWSNSPTRSALRRPRRPHDRAAHRGRTRCASAITTPTVCNAIETFDVRLPQRGLHGPHDPVPLPGARRNGRATR